MQFTFRIDDDNYLTFDLQLSRPGVDSSLDGPELVAAVVSDSKLLKLKAADIIGIAAQVVDYAEQGNRQPKVAGDWYENEFLPATGTREIIDLGDPD